MKQKIPSAVFGEGFIHYQIICFYCQNFARVGGFHMQGISGRSHSLLLQALNNAADGCLRLALRVKINEKKASIHLSYGV